MGDPAEPYLYPDLDLDLDPDLFVDMPPWTMDDLPDAVLDNQRSNQAFTKAEMEESLSSSTSQLDCVSRVAPIEDLDRVQDLGLALTANAQVKWSAPTASIGALVRPRNLDTASTANALIHEHESASCQPPTLDLSSWPQAEPPEMQAMSVKDNFDPAVPVSETFPDELILPAAATKVAGDSDCSWTDGDQEDQWSIELQSQLIRFREQQQRTTTVTSALPGHQRRKVHSMCHLMCLSHVTIKIKRTDTGRHCRVLISKAQIMTDDPLQFTPSTPRWTPWNHRLAPWAPGFIDPLFIVVEGYMLDSKKARFFQYTKSAVLEAFTAAGLPKPKDVIDPASVGTNHKSAETALVVLEYSSIELAVVVATSAFLLQRQVFPFKDRRVSISSCEFWHHDVSRPITADIKNLAGKSLATSSAKRSRSVGYYFSESSAGDSSSGSNFSFVDSDCGANNSPLKKSKREEKVAGGYPCQAEGCFMMFDRACDRRKHEKVHSDRRAYTCAQCGHGFHDRKDLARHARRRGHASTTAE